MKKLLRSRVLAVTAAAGVLVSIGGVGGAVAGGLINSHDIKNNTIRSWDVHDGTLGMRDLNNTTQSLIDQGGPRGPRGRRGPEGPQGPQGTQGQDAGLAKTFTGAPTPVAHIGGKFADGKTAIGTFDLQPGTYVVNAEGFFESQQATSGASQLELALRDSAGNVYGTCFTGETSPTSGRDASCTSTQAVTVKDPTTVTLYAFGYQDDQSSTDSGAWMALGTANVIQVG